MNRVYKVIWSKAKHCYVVTSEIAKGYGKSAGSKGVKALLSGLVALSIAMGGYGLAGAVYVDSRNAKDGAYTTQVYTKKAANNKFATKDELNAKANAADVYSKTEADNQFATKTDLDAKANADDAKVDADGTYVKAAYTVGRNLSVLDEYVTKNTEAVLKVATQVGENSTALGKLDKQVKDNLKVGVDGVISKVTGDDSTPSSPVNKLVLNVDGNNRITMDGNGIKVGTNSTVIASDGVFAGGDTAADAKAALNANGSIKGASGKFTVDGATGNVEAYGTLNAANGKFSVGNDGQLSVSNGSFKVDTDGGIYASNGSFKVDTNGGINIGNGTATIDNNGNITGKKLDVGTGDIKGGKITGAELDVGNGNIKGGQITGTGLDVGAGTINTTGTVKAGDVQTGTLTTNGNATIGGALTVTGKLNMDEIDMTKVGIVGDNNVTASTKVAAGEITSYKKATSTKAGGGEKESAIDYDEKGTSTWAKATDADGKWNKSSLTVEGKGIKSIATDGTNNASTNLSNNGFNTYASDGKNKTYTKQTATDIKNTAEKGMISHTAKNLVNRAYENMTNTVDKDLTTTVGGNETRTVEGTLKETVTGDVTEDYKANLSTKVGGNQAIEVTGNQENTVGGTLTETVTGKVVEDYKDDMSTKVGGNQSIEVTGDQSNTVGGALTETVTGKVVEDYKDDMSTKVGGNQSIEVTGDQSNTVGGALTETVTGDVTEDYKANLETTVTGDSSLSATNIKNKASTSITSQIGEDGKVKSEMTADGITNTAKDGTIYNKSKDILNEASGDIINWADGEIGNVATKITNITGDNTVTSDTNGTTFENKEHSTAVKEGTVTKTTISGNTIETGQATMDYADVTKDLSVGGNATVENDLTVKGASEFVGRADFRYDVFMDENLTVAKETRTDTLYVDHDGYVGGNLNVEGNIETHDAVLSADSRQVVTGRQLYQTNERVDRLDNRIKKVGANAAALAALRPGDFNPDDKFSIAAGFGSYRNANAAALGLFYRPNENVLLSLGTSFGDGENMVNAGVSVKFGRGKSMAERRKEMADEVSSMRDEMRSQDERIAELEEMLKKQSELIEKLSKES